MQNSLTQQLAAFTHAVTYEILPHSVSAIASDHFLDTFGCCLAACNAESYKILTSYLATEEGTPQATALGYHPLLPMPQAAFVNGLLARYAEFDDMAMPDLHPSGVIFPIVLAVAENLQCSGKELLAAFAVGIELCIRLARAGFDTVERNSRFLKRGQDSTAICGVVAGAAAAAKMLGLDPQQIAHAMGIAVSFASGSIEANRSGGNIKQLQSGWAAKSALQAALLAKHGITAPVEALEGRYGFYQCFIDGDFDSTILTTYLGIDWLLQSLRYKPYPSNYYTHSSIDAALALRNEGLNSDDIKSIHLEIALPMFRTVAEPIERKRTPQSAYEAKFSAPYTIAAALLGGADLGIGLTDFTLKNIQDPRHLALMQKIEISSSAECNAIFPDHAPAFLTINTDDGKRWVKKILVNRGSMENPLTKKELELKFKSNASHTIKDSQTIDTLYKTLNKMATLQTVFPLLTLLKNI